MPDIDFETFSARARITGDKILVGNGAAPFTGGLLDPDQMFPGGFGVPALASDPGSPANGLIWYNTTAGQVKMRLAGITRVLIADFQPYQTPAAGSYAMTTFSGMGSATGTIVGVANGIDLFPWVCRADIAVDRLSCNVTTLLAAALGKIILYDSDANGLPNALLAETATLDFATTGAKEATASLTLRKGLTYWFGMRHSATATISAWPTQSAPDLTGNSINVNMRKIIRRTLAFATAAPSTWGYLVSEVQASSTLAPPAIWLRSA